MANLIGLFRHESVYLICLVLSTMPCASPAASTALSIANYLYSMNITWTYGLLGNLALDGTCEIDVASLVIVLVWIFYFVVNFPAQVR